jgi:hypothetical protein
MIVQNVFDRKVVRFQCEDETFYKNEEFLKNINETFEHPSLTSSGGAVAERIGHAPSTVGKYFLRPLMLPGSEQLKKWIDDRILEAATHFVDFIPRNIEYVRNWSNKMYKESEGLVHRHKGSPDGVGIFYVNIPENGGDLVFIRDGAYLTRIEDFAPEDIVFAGTNAGELVLHDPSILHSVSKHNNDEPRICIVVEFKYIL